MPDHWIELDYMRSERDRYAAMIEWRLNACWSIQWTKHKWKKTTTTTLEKKIKLDAVREHQRAHNHREFIVTFRFGSAFKRRVLIKCGEMGREREEWKKNYVVRFVDEFAFAGTMRWVRNRISIRNLNKNAIKTTPPDGTSSTRLPDLLRESATATHTHNFVCKLALAREWVWVRVWQNLFLLPFSLLFLFSLFHWLNLFVATASVSRIVRRAMNLWCSVPNR